VFDVEVLRSRSTPENRGERDEDSAAGCGRVAARNKAKQSSKEKPSQQHKKVAIQKRREHMACLNWLCKSEDLANVARSITPIQWRSNDLDFARRNAGLTRALQIVRAFKTACLETQSFRLVVEELFASGMFRPDDRRILLIVYRTTD